MAWHGMACFVFSKFIYKINNSKLERVINQRNFCGWILKFCLLRNLVTSNIKIYTANLKIIFWQLSKVHGNSESSLKSPIIVHSEWVNDTARRRSAKKEPLYKITKIMRFLCRAHDKQVKRSRKIISTRCHNRWKMFILKTSSVNLCKYNVQYTRSCNYA